MSIDKVFARKFDPATLKPNFLWYSLLFIVIMNFEPELRYRFYCISVLIKFIAFVFELGIFNVTLHIQKFWHKFPSNYKPSQFWNANFPPTISPFEYKPLPKISLSKGSFKRYKPQGLFSEFYGIFHVASIYAYFTLLQLQMRISKQLITISEKPNVLE